jgi:hypothetical protein
MVADALFEHIDVLGLRKATAHLTADIVRHGLAAALPEEVGTLICGRGERGGTYPCSVSNRRRPSGTVEAIA